MKRTLLMAAALILMPGVAMAKDLFVQSAKTKIMSEPSFKAAVVDTVSRGAQIEQVEAKDGWFKVKAGAKSGWVNHLAVAESPPMDKVTVITADSEDLQDKSRKRSSSMTAAAAARGLSDAERKRMSEVGQADYRSLMHLEEMAGKISDREIQDFDAGK